MESFFAALGLMEEEDRDMIIDALAVAARKWRREAAEARVMTDFGEINKRLIQTLKAREDVTE